MNAWSAIAVSVAMHVCWNLLVRAQGRDARLLVWALAAHCLLLGPWGLHGLVTQADWTEGLGWLLLASSLANVMYFVGLDRAYHHAPVALVYPMVRSSPLLIGLWSAWLFGEVLGWMSWIAMGISITGLLILASSAWRNTDGQALPWAMCAMLATSMYSITDKAATAYLPTVASLLGFITVGYALSLLSLLGLLRREHGRWLPERRPPFWAVLTAGMFVGMAYVLVIHAMRTLPAAIVVAFTNAGIVLAGVLSIFLFRERNHWKRRLTGMLVVMLGLMLLAWGSLS